MDSTPNHAFERTLGVMNGTLDYGHWVFVAALALVHQHDLEEIEASLIAQACPADIAAKLVLFIPSAFAAEYYGSMGIEFPDYFLVGDPGQFKQLPYADEPIYVEAKRLARRWLTESRPSVVERVLDWSAEAKSIKEAKAKGLTPVRVSAVHHGID
jgi:hypothetical protein